MAPETRLYESHGTMIVVEHRDDGDFNVSMRFGPMSIRITVPSDMISALFGKVAE